MFSQSKNTKPQARVNITLNVDNNHSQIKTELPLHLLLLGDYGAEENGEVVEVEANHLSQAFAALKPALDFTVSNHLNKSFNNLNVSLQFKSLADFTPDHLMQTIPELKKLLAMRHLLNDLKSMVADSDGLEKTIKQLSEDHHA